MEPAKADCQFYFSDLLGKQTVGEFSLRDDIPRQDIFLEFSHIHRHAGACIIHDFEYSTRSAFELQAHTILGSEFLSCFPRCK